MDKDDLNDRGINIKKEYLEIEEALPFFPGRRGHAHMTKSSLMKRICQGKMPKGSVINITGRYIIRRSRLIGQNNNTAA